MLRVTPSLHKMASTHGGMRRILKKRLPVQRYIELAVKAGSYKTPSTRPHYLGLQDVPESKGFLSPREREERLKLRRGIIDYPAEVRAYDAQFVLYHALVVIVLNFDAFVVL
jgi:hypothetical protein